MVGVSTARVNWILDADIRSFFDKIDQSWLVRFLGACRAFPSIARELQLGQLRQFKQTPSV
jgi:hypothetical protein